MAFAKKKAKTVDPISDRARTLNDQIAALEAEIKRLDTAASAHARAAPAFHRHSAWRDH